MASSHTTQICRYGQIWVVWLLCACCTQVAAYHVAGGWWDSREEALIVQRRRQSLLVIGEQFSKVFYQWLHIVNKLGH